ncbi:MAG: 5'(3')-deoxyribonucleotidase [Lewinella sp.]
MRIIIDMDEVMADNFPSFYRAAEERFGIVVGPEDHLGKKVYDLPGLAEVRNVLYEKGHFRHLPVIENAVEVIRELYEHYEVYIVTTATEFRYSFLDKYEWLEEHFPFIHHSRIVFCGDKSIVHGDFMIDDKAKNLSTFTGVGLLFTSNPNLGEQRYHRVNNWLEVRDYFRQEREGRIAQMG